MMAGDGTPADTADPHSLLASPTCTCTGLWAKSLTAEDYQGELPDINPKVIAEKISGLVLQQEAPSDLLTKACNGHLNFYSTTKQSLESSLKQKVQEPRRNQGNAKRLATSDNCIIVPQKRRKLEIHLKISSFDQEEYALYRKYQIKVHGDSQKKLQWVPFEIARPLLERNPYVVLSHYLVEQQFAMVSKHTRTVERFDTDTPGCAPSEDSSDEDIDEVNFCYEDTDKGVEDEPSFLAGSAPVADDSQDYDVGNIVLDVKGLCVKFKTEELPFLNPYDSVDKTYMQIWLSPSFDMNSEF
ncbi:hypothetical protein ZIOFF_000204 [Zingiber officinale]|uniref:Uncharacterized protein n=1 Tax=Zingiber officinale TaxID=94328 RepID=A0A8J5I4A4_ZINOF|nr:hypothetical protein ZIOFF_000204 [Zingiber officinale]